MFFDIRLRSKRRVSLNGSICEVACAAIYVCECTQRGNRLGFSTLWDLHVESFAYTLCKPSQGVGLSLFLCISMPMYNFVMRECPAKERTAEGGSAAGVLPIALTWAYIVAHSLPCESDSQWAVLVSGMPRTGEG